MDAGDTVFTLHADGHEVTVTVYGLGTLDPGEWLPGCLVGRARGASDPSDT